MAPVLLRSPGCLVSWLAPTRMRMQDRASLVWHGRSLHVQRELLHGLSRAFRFGPQLLPAIARPVAGKARAQHRRARLMAINPCLVGHKPRSLNL